MVIAAWVAILWVAGVDAVDVADIADGTTDSAVQEVVDCMKANSPKATSEQTVEFRQVDRVGGERTTRAKIYAKQEDGLHKVVLRFSKPLDMRGSAFLLLEKQPGPNDMFLYSPEVRKTKRVTGRATGGSLFGTDFSYEDFERWQGIEKKGAVARLEDASVEGRDAYVLSSKPAAELKSGYEEVVQYIDKQTCVLLKAESFEPGKQLRKRLEVKVEDLIKEGEVWVAPTAVMRDLRDESETHVTLEEVEIDGTIRDRVFSLGELSKSRD